MDRFPTHRVHIEVDVVASDAQEAEKLIKLICGRSFRNAEIISVHSYRVTDIEKRV